MERNENLQKVYNALKNEGYTDIGDFNSFSSMMSDSNNVRKVYDGLLVSGYTDLGDFDTFKRNVYQSSVSLGDYRKVAEETHDAQEPQVEDGNRFGILGKMGKYMGSPSAYIPTPQVVEKKEPTPEELKQMQDAARYREDLRTELQDSGAIDSMNDAKKEARQGKFKALGEMLVYTPQTSMAGISSSTFSEPDVAKAVEAGREFTQNKLMESTLNEALDMARQGEKNLDGSYAIGDFARGVWDEAVDISTWDMGYSDLVNAATLNQLVQKYESDRDNLTATEKKVLEALGMSAAVQEAYAGTTGIGYAVGQSIPHSAAFIGQMALNPAKGAGEALAKAAIKKVGKQGVMSTVGKVGTRLLTEALETGVMTATTGAGRVAADALERINGRTEYTIDNDGYIVYGGQTDNDTVRNAWWKAFGATFIEGYTESLGRAVFDPALDALKNIVGGKLKKGSLNKLGEIMLGEEPSRLAEAMRVLKSAGKVDSMVGELLEEEVGMIINALAVGDQSLDPEDPNFVFNLENQLTTLISTALMTGTINAAEAAGDYFTRRDINKKANDAEKVCRALYGEGWDAMRDKMDSSTPEEAVQMLSGIMQDPAIEQRKKAAMLEYASKRITAQYFNAEDEKVRESLVKEKRELHDAFNAGLEARLPDFYNMRKAVDGAKAALDEYGEQSNRMEEINAAIRGINESPEKMNEILSGMYEEEQNLIRDYVYSRTRMNGAYVGRSNKLEDYVDEFAFAMEPFVVTNENGERTITTANLDRVSGSIPVYVMSNDGTNAWVMREDGSSNMVLTKELKNIFTNNAEDVIEVFRQQATETMDAETENAVKHHPKTQSPRVGLVLTNTDGTQMVVTEMVEGGMKIAPAVFKDGQYLPKGGAATQTITTEQAYGWQDSYNQKQDEKTSFKIGTEQTFYLKGKAIKGVITGIGPDGNYNVDLEEDVEGYDKVGSYTLSQMREMTTPPTRTNNLSAETTKNDITPADEIKQSVSEEVANGQVEDNVTEPTAVAESVNTALSRVPKDAKGNPLYEQTDADTAWDAIMEQTEGDAEMAQRIAEEMVADKKAALTKMQKGKPKKGSTVAEKIANEKAHMAAIAQAEQEVAAWEKIAQTEARRREAAMSEADRYAAEMEQKNISEGLSALGEPQSLQEYVLAQLAGGAYKLRWNDKENGTKGFGSHTGLSTEEMKARLSMVDNKNGLTPEEIAHDIVENMDASFGEVDAMDVTDMVIDAVSTYASRRAMLNGMVESRAELLRQQEIAEQEAKDAWYMEQYHATEEELAAYNEYLAEFAEEIYGEEIYGEDSDYEQRIATFAEIQLENDNQGTDAGLRSSADQGEGLASDREGSRSVGETEQLDRREVFADAAGVAEAEDGRAGGSVSAQSDDRQARIDRAVREYWDNLDNSPEAVAAAERDWQRYQEDVETDASSPVYTEERLDNGDVRITGTNSNGQIASVAIERNGKVISVDTYEDGALFERTDYDANGNAAKVTRYKDGEVVSEQEYKDGKRKVTANYFEMAEEAQKKRKSKKKSNDKLAEKNHQQKENRSETRGVGNRPQLQDASSYESFVERVAEYLQRSYKGTELSEEVATIIRDFNKGKTIIARTEQEKALLKMLRVMTNNDVEWLLSELKTKRDALAGEERKAYDDAVTLVSRYKGRGEHNAVVRAMTGADLREKLPLTKIDELFDKYNSDADVAELYRRVRAIAELIGLDFWFDDNMIDVQAGGFRGADNRVRFNAHMLYSPFVSDQTKASVIVHEILHAVADYAIETQETIKLGLTPKVKLSNQVLNAANTILNIYEKAVKGNPLLVHEEYDNVSGEMKVVPDYGTDSAREMLMEISNPEFRDKLKQIEYNGRSVWQRIWDAIKSMFTQSSDVTNPTAYDTMAKALDVLINEFSVDAYRKYSGLEESAIKLSAEENLRFRKKEEPKELIAVHNISEDNLKKVLEAGSLIMPSIAITKADMGHDSFGEISLLFDKSTINPFDRRNKVYGGDAWTPRFPRIGVKLNEKVVSRINKKAYELIDDRRLREIFSLSAEVYPDNIEKVISDYGVEGYYNKEWMKLAYLLDNGKKVKMPTKAKDYGIASEDIVRLAKEKGLSVNEIYEDYDFYKNNPDFVTQVKEARDEARLSSIPEEQRDEMRERMQSRPLSEAAFDSYIRGALEMEKDLANGGLKEVVDRQALRDLIEKKVKTDNAEYNKWVDNLFEGIVEKRGIRNNRDWYTPSGNLRPWGHLYDPATPANILKHMLAENEQGGSGGLFDSNIMGASAETYESIEEIREKGRQRLKELPYEEYDEWSNSVAERMAKICDDFLSPSQKNSIGGAIDAKIEITNAVAKDKTAKSIYKHMKREYPNFTMEHAKQVEEIVKEIQESATGYFEAKPQRLVSVNEVMAAVVPSNASKEIVDALKSNGIEVVTYKKGDEEARKRVVKRVSSSMDIRFRDGAPFFSNAERAVENIKQQKATPEQWLAMIKKDGGLKAGEDKWMGLSDWLTEQKGKGVKSLTKDEVLQFIRENQIEIEEVNYAQSHDYGNDEDYNAIAEEIDDAWDDYVYEAQRGIVSYGQYRELDDVPMEQVQYHVREKIKDIYGDDIFDHIEIDEDGNVFVLGDTKPINSTRLDYTTEGLENKKEIAFVVPTIESWNQSDNIHFGDAGEGRAVAWVRFGETADEDGKRVLVIDEVQSKRHDEGRSKGYSDLRDYDKKMAALEEEAAELLARRNKLIKVLDEKYGGFTKYLKHSFNGQRTSLVPNPSVMTSEEIKEWNETSQDSIRERENELKTLKRGVPDAPFDKNYHELVMKRMLRYAAENGFDKVAWNTGKQVAERFGIGGVVEKIYADHDNYDGEPHKYVSIYLRNGRFITLEVDKDGRIEPSKDVAEEYDGKMLSEVIGKEYAEKIVNLPQSEQSIEIEPEDMHVGGTDRVALYDEMIPRFMNKYVKKWGAKVGEVTLPNVEAAGRTMWSVDVTPEMRESVMQGQPMFREGMGTISDREVSYENDPIAKFQGKPRYYGKRAAAFAERERRRMENAAKEASEMLGIEAEIITDASTLQGRKAKAKGWYDIINKKVVVVVPNHVSMGDAVRTVLHEGVAHHGLRELFGAGFDAMLDNVYNNVAPELKARIDAIAERTGVSTSVATEEYLASLAEETNFEEAKNRGWWSKIKQFFVDMLRKLSMPGLNLKEEITDNELRYLLWRSYQNLVDPNSYLKPLGYLDDVAKQKELKVGEYAENTMATPRAAEMSEAEEWSAITMQRIEELEAQAAQLENEIADMEADRDADDASRYNIWEQQIDPLREQLEDVYAEIQGLYDLEAEDEDIEDYEAEREAEKQRQLYQKRIDNAYLKAVREGNWEEATDLFRQYVLSKAEDEGIVPMDYGVGYRGGAHSSIAKKVKEENPDAIAEAAYQMSIRIPKGSILVPMPSRTGNATYTVKLAEAIAKATDSEVRDVLKGKARMSVYEAKQKGIKMTPEDLGMYTTEELPKGKNIVIIDNVIDKGTTALAAVSAVKGASVVAYAYTLGDKQRVASLKLAEPVTYDDNKRIIPLSQRFNKETDDIRYRNADEIISEVEREAAALGVPVRIVRSVDELPDEDTRKRAVDGQLKGYFDLRTGEVVVYEPNTDDANDAKRTILHETVGHKGLRRLLGDKNFDKTMMQMYRMLPEAERKKVWDAAMTKYGDLAVAMEEYLAEKAELAKKPKWWQGILTTLKMAFKRATGVYLTDADINYLLWRARKKLEADTPMDMAVSKMLKQAAQQSELTEEEVNQLNEARERLFDKSKNADYLRRRTGDAQREYEDAVNTLAYKSQEAFQDSMLALKTLQEAVAKESGKEIRDWENAHMAENRMSSINLRDHESYKKNFYKKLLMAVSDIMDMGVDDDAILNYMMAKHGLERNEVFAQRDAVNDAEGDATKQQELYEKNRKTDYAGLTALTGMSNIEDAEAEAQRMVDEFEQKVPKHLVDELWRRNKACNQRTLDITYNAGIMDLETYNKLSNQFQYYIPLQGFDETTAEEVYFYVGGKDSPYNAPIKAARGRKSKADNPIATIGSVAESAIVDANRNKMKQEFYAMAVNHKTDLISVSDVWMAYDPASDSWVAQFPTIPNDATPSQVKSILDAFEARMEAAAAANPDLYAKASEKPNVPYRVVKKADMNEHQVIVKRNGRDVVMTINGNPRAAQAINGLTNPEANKNLVNDIANWINRNLSANFTTRNPAFVISNFVRDSIYTNSMVWVKESPMYAKKYHKNFLKATTNITSLVNKYKRYEEGDKSALDMNDPLQKMFYEFMANGGETGYTAMHSVDDYKRMSQKELKKMLRKGAMSNAQKVVDVIAEGLDTFGRWAEDTSRFAAYMTSREMGRTVARSIYDAKEISVNFNKKGAGSRMRGKFKDDPMAFIAATISQMGRNCYVFWNAGVQGLTNFGRAAKENKGKFTVMAMAAMAAGMLIPVLFSTDDDEDDEYYLLPEYVRRNNICIKVGKNKFITLPLPIEIRALYGMGELAYSYLSGKEEMTTGEATKKVIQQISQVMPIDMMADGGGAMALVPSAVKPVVEAIENKNWTGDPIYRKETVFNENDPTWMLAYKSTSPELVWLSRQISEATNENTPSGEERKYDRGWADNRFFNNPAVWEHIFEGYLGGIATITNQTKKTLLMPFNEDLKDVRNVPIASRFVKSAGESAKEYKLADEYYGALDIMDELSDELSSLKKDMRDASKKLDGAKTELEKAKAQREYDNVSKVYNEMNEDAYGVVTTTKKLNTSIKKLEDLHKTNPDEKISFNGEMMLPKDAINKLRKEVIDNLSNYMNN